MGMVSIMVGSVVDAAKCEVNARMVQHSANTHNCHVEEESDFVTGKAKRWAVQDTVVAHCFYGVDAHVVERRGELVRMVMLVQCLVEHWKMHHSMPPVFRNRLNSEGNNEIP